jgi:acetyl-CoA carboxylase carboxyl transferase subunit alpha
LKALNLIDKIVNEPLGGAHRDPKQMAILLKRALADTLRQFQGVKTKDLMTARHEKLMSYGKFKEITPSE